MAAKKHDVGTTITTPSPYGSHLSMLVRELENGKVVLKDDYGEYTTTRDRLDNGMADPNRNGPRRNKG
jgi:hypothetical protein